MWGIPELVRYQEHFRDYKITVYQGWLVKTLFEGQVESANHINLLYDDVEEHHVIIKLTCAMAGRYVLESM